MVDLDILLDLHTEVQMIGRAIFLVLDDFLVGLVEISYPSHIQHWCSFPIYLCVDLHLPQEVQEKQILKIKRKCFNIYYIYYYLPMLF